MQASAVWTALGAPKRILAPMTEASDLAFRLLWYVEQYARKKKNYLVSSIQLSFSLAPNLVLYANMQLA